jgi:dihydroorotate dehydrogenase (fumarate)
VDLSIAATGGFHRTEDIVKALLVGADVTHLCSVLMQKGPEQIAVLIKELKNWLEEHEYDSVMQMKGSLSESCAINPAAIAHCNYMNIIKQRTGVNR